VHVISNSSSAINRTFGYDGTCEVGCASLNNLKVGLEKEKRFPLIERAPKYLVEERSEMKIRLHSRSY
jgi:hypothetical protein